MLGIIPNLCLIDAVTGVVRINNNFPEIAVNTSKPVVSACVAIGLGSVSEDMETRWGVVGGSNNGCVRVSNINKPDSDKRQPEQEDKTGDTANHLVTANNGPVTRNNQTSISEHATSVCPLLVSRAVERACAGKVMVTVSQNVRINKLYHIAGKVLNAAGTPTNVICLPVKAKRVATQFSCARGGVMRCCQMLEWGSGKGVSAMAKADA